MTLRKIVRHPHPVLKQKAEPIAVVDDAIRQLAADMAETMYAADGVGLAANQVNVLKRICLCDCGDGQGGSRLYTLINPVVTLREGRATRQEGCLSIPGVWEDVERAARVIVKATGLDGNDFTLDVNVETDGLLPVCLQHEIDHLDGVLFVDYLSRLKQEIILRKMKKLAREEAAEAKKAAKEAQAAAK